MADKIRYKNVHGTTWTKVIMPDRDKKREEVIAKAEDEASKSSGEESKKELRTIERFFLTGEVKVEPDTTLKAKDNIRLSGLGSYISGLYFVEKVRRVWGKGGFSQTIEVSRNAVGDSIKRGMTTEPTPVLPSSLNTTREDPREEKVPVIQQRIHVLLAGETLSSIALKYYGESSQYLKIARANNIKSREYSTLQVGRRLIIP